MISIKKKYNYLLAHKHFNTSEFRSIIVLYHYTDTSRNIFAKPNKNYRW